MLGTIRTFSIDYHNVQCRGTMLWRTMLWRTMLWRTMLWRTMLWRTMITTFYYSYQLKTIKINSPNQFLVMYYIIILQHCITSLYYGIILRHCITSLYYIIVLQNCITALYYIIVLQHFITAMYYSIVLQHCITAMYYGNVLQLYITAMYYRYVGMAFSRMTTTIVFGEYSKTITWRYITSMLYNVTHYGDTT